MSVYKKFSPLDYATVPFNAHKQYDFSSASAATNRITHFDTRWISESISRYSGNNGNNDNVNAIKYQQLDHLYYRNFKLNVNNRLGDNHYLKQRRVLYENANILSIPAGLYGYKIKPGSFYLSSSDKILVDDKFGNLIISGTNVSNYITDPRANILNIGPVKGFKRYDLNTIEGYLEGVFYRDGDPRVNPTYTSYSTKELSPHGEHDDSYYFNPIEYKEINFSEKLLYDYDRFPGIDFNGSTSGIKIPHNDKFNFNKGDDFTISFFTSGAENALGETNYLISKNTTKTVIPSPSEGTSGTYRTQTSGASQTKDVFAEPQYPFEIYLEHVNNGPHIFFKRSDGTITSVVSTPFPTSSEYNTYEFDPGPTGSSIVGFITSSINPTQGTDLGKMFPTTGVTQWVGGWDGGTNYNRLSTLYVDIDYGSILGENPIIDKLDIEFSNENSHRNITILGYNEPTELLLSDIGTSPMNKVENGTIHIKFNSSFSAGTGGPYLYITSGDGTLIKYKASTYGTVGTMDGNSVKAGHGPESLRDAILSSNGHGSDQFSIRIGIFNDIFITQLKQDQQAQARFHGYDWGNTNLVSVTGEDGLINASTFDGDDTIKFTPGCNFEVLYEDNSGPGFAQVNRSFENNRELLLNPYTQPYKFIRLIFLKDQIQSTNTDYFYNNPLNYSYNNFEAYNEFQSDLGGNSLIIKQIIAYEEGSSQLVHVTCRNSSSQMEIFLNGQTTDKIILDNTIKPTQNNANIYIGNKGDKSNHYTGSLSQINIYNQALTNTQVYNHYISNDGSPYVGNIFYSNGIVTITQPGVEESVLSRPGIGEMIIGENFFINPDGSPSFVNFDIHQLKFQGSHLIYEHEYQCTVDEHEFNNTLNLTTRKIKSHQTQDLADFATGSLFKPYVTTIGLYNKNNELLVVGKLGQPIRTSNETDTTFIVRWDT